MKPTWYRRVIAALAVCIAAGGSIGLAWRTIAAPAPEQPIRIATMEWPGYYSIMRADKEGRLAPLPATLVIKPDIASMIGAFSRHEADVIPLVLSDAVMLAADGVDLRIIAVLDYSDQSDVLLARPEFTAVRDLRGHEVAFDGVQTFSHLFVLDALARGGLTERAVTFRDLPAMQVPAEVLAGRLAAGHTWGPLAAIAVAHGCHVLAKAGDDPGVITEVLVVQTETLARHHRQLREMMAVIWASVDQTRADESAAIAAAADILKKKSESLDAITGNVHLWNQAESLARMSGDAQTSIPMRLALIAEQFRKRGQLPPGFSADRLIDTSLYQQGLLSPVSLHQRPSP